MSQTSTLEINGKRYNALTGRLVSHPQTLSRSVDGMVHHPAPTHQAAAAAHHTTVTRTVHHARPHQAQHSHTLMRQAVHRPEPSMKRRHHAATHTGSLVGPVNFDITPKHSVNTVDSARLKLAHQIHKSKMVTRFSPATELANTPMVPRSQPAYMPAQPLVQQTTRPLPKQPSEDIFEKALATATSHKEPYHPVKHKKSHKLRNVMSAIVSSIALVLLVGFVAYQNAAAIQLKVASSRAGLNATLPAWQPSGFTLGSLSYGAGTVTVSFKSHVAPSSYTLTQTASNWDSSTLLSDYVLPNNDTYDTVKSAGSTIYMYGNNNATWVNGGIWYKLTTDGSLSTSQIVNIATSMQS